MNLDPVEKVANAVLYEGYMLYPYRATSVKNRQRFNWGALAPKAYSEAQNGTEAWEMQTECLFEGDKNSEISVRIRFLQLTNREIGRVDEPTESIPDKFELVSSIEINGQLYQAWQEAVERNVALPVFRPGDEPKIMSIDLPETTEVEAIKDDDGRIAGLIIRKRFAQRGTVEATVDTSIGHGLGRLKVSVRNTTPYQDAESDVRGDALLRSFVSTHAIIRIEGGEFVSLLEPPEKFAEAAISCKNRGAFPVLVGAREQRTCMLSSPIILYDYPEIAHESPGDLFDSTEIDEILTLRIMTMTDQEKREMRAVDDRARKILERTELMSEEELLGMHGALRGMERSRKASHG